MVHSIFLLSCITLTVLLFGYRRALLQMARDTSLCYALLQQQSDIATTEDQAALPKKINHGKSLPHFQATDVVSGQSISPQDLIGKSTIVIFFNEKNYEEWSMETLLAFFRSWWYHIDGNIYVILLTAESLKIEDIPHQEIMKTNIGQYLVFGTSNESAVFRNMGLTQTPSVVELDAGGIVRRIGFFRDGHQK